MWLCVWDVIVLSSPVRGHVINWNASIEESRRVVEVDLAVDSLAVLVLLDRLVFLVAFTAQARVTVPFHLLTFVINLAVELAFGQLFLLFA
jgi:hypothetical protein